MIKFENTNTRFSNTPTYKNSNSKKFKRDVSAEEIDYRKNVAECSFTPVINKVFFFFF